MMSIYSHCLKTFPLYLVSPFLLISFLFGCSISKSNNNFSNDYRNSQLALSQLNKENSQIETQGTAEYLDFLASRVSAGTQVSYKLILYKSNLPFAYSIGSNTIALSSALIEACQTESELVFVLAHEIGHYQLGHQPRSQSEYDLDQEIQADDFGLKLAAVQGYNGCLAPSILRRISLGSPQKRDIYEKRIDSLVQLQVSCAQALAINTTRQFAKFKDSLRDY